MVLIPSQAIDAYLKLEPSLSVGPAKDDQERKSNSNAFEVAFYEVLSNAGIEADALMVTTDTIKDKREYHRPYVCLAMLIRGYDGV
jgi:hypothetical protein